MKRWLLALLALPVLGTAVRVGIASGFVGRAGPPIRVGILHSQTGAMAISEKSMIDAESLGFGGDQCRAAAFLGGAR